MQKFIIIIISIVLLMGLFSLFKSEPVYEPEDAKVFIYDRLPTGDQERLDKEVVLKIIDTEFQFVQENGRGPGGEELLVLMQSSGVTGIENVTSEDIERVMEIEGGYMESIGIEIIKAGE